MALLNILCYPDPRLHKVATPVTAFDDKLRKLVADMLETMYEAQGVGLAATQVDVHQRLVVLDTSEERNQATVLINPEITWYSEERVKGEEGCLSVPGIYDGVERAVAVKVKAADEHGQVRELEASCPYLQACRVVSTPPRCHVLPHAVRSMRCEQIRACPQKSRA
jgi:peptide deformylase